MKKILIIDDEPDLVDLVTNRLVSNNFEVFSASNGEEGLARLNDINPDLLILDVCMPKMDGYTFIRELRQLEEGGDTPVIMLTAKDRMEDLFKIEGISDYVLKPFDSEVLIKTINKVLNIVS